MDAAKQDFQTSPWGDSVVVDLELKKLVKIDPDNNNKDYSSTIRSAFILLEQRIRDTAGLSPHDFTKELVDKAFQYPNGRLQPVSPVPGECTGFYNLLLGLFLYYRNPIAHRPIVYSQQAAWPVLHLINHALLLVNGAAEKAFNIKDFVGNHEGQILRRRDYRLDVDGDSDLEIVILLELGPVLDNGSYALHLMPVILKKTDKGYRRIPTEAIKGGSIYGPWKVELRHVTSVSIPDVVVYWYTGETSDLAMILRKDGDKYVIAKRDMSVGKEPYNGPLEHGFIVHGRQDLDFADVDGDGLVEIVQSLSFEMEDLKAKGHELPQLNQGDWIYECRLLKWDDQKKLIAQVEERLAVTLHDLPMHYKTPFGE